jgi:translation elongation factor P/translation initiation factor 5A
MINASELRGGMAIKYVGQDYRVVAADYHPGQGKMGGATHARLQKPYHGDTLGTQLPC